MLDYATIGIEKNMNTKKNCLVFIGVFNFLLGGHESTHAFSHSCLPLPNFFGQVMHFCKSPWLVLIETYCKYLQTFPSIVTYWHALKLSDQNKCLENLFRNPTHHNL